LLEGSSRIFLGRVSIPNTPFLITEIRFLWQGEYADKDAISEESVREKCDIYLFILVYLMTLSQYPRDSVE
jgi:hypothetical protein